MPVGGYYITDCLDRQMFQSYLERFSIHICLRVPLDYPHYLCYNRLVISHDVSLRINPYHYCCGVDGTGGTGSIAGENST